MRFLRVVLMGLFSLMEFLIFMREMILVFKLLIVVMILDFWIVNCVVFVVLCVLEFLFFSVVK